MSWILQPYFPAASASAAAASIGIASADGYLQKTTHQPLVPQILSKLPWITCCSYQAPFSLDKEWSPVVLLQAALI